MDFSRTRQQFYQEIQQPEASISLAKAALYIAAEAYPKLNPVEYLQQLDRMAAEIQSQLPTQRYPLRIIQTINDYLYGQLGFRGNTEDYYDPRNSFLNEVLNRRTGIPITLALVYLELAQRLEFPMVGIGMPGHFLIRPDFEEVGIFVDAFDRGEVLFPEDCAKRLAQIYGQPIELKPQYLAPVSPRQFLARMLTNLKVIYLHNHQIDLALAAIERILLLFPQAPTELRDRGLISYELGNWSLATQDLEDYLYYLPQAQDRLMIQQILAKMDTNQG
ncbi:MAG: transglutaminase family protein [Roseofilum sp. SBFL]|uniref:SirB1 family protein n=1 Tax=unclassified Roseofilum TaxID=2620099 RepID=UPI001B004AEB|nr:MULTISPECIES: transglutaminase-like domain-containing protein [unclassified Roseofilum]MBP0012730.1 transglutaminase family protein [Roseofilum sp. SID3]MBP0023700.1 transglutaminase family protein [Roseofilum sp. SID2]MBP0039863.1 transglutaminase family protein [Roseofilum sp. SID1]MBP0042920.1 transglutaminase family protein [Roseofilum sp. SBFL]